MVAREHGITARNGGQIVKEFVTEIGFDTTILERKTEGKRMRAKKLKMLGGEISVPCHKTASMIKSEWTDMIRSGQLTLGEPCAPYTLTKYSVVGGKVERSESVIYGHKVPLVYIRKKLLQKYEAYMRLHTNVELQNMSRSELTHTQNIANVVFDTNAEDQQLRVFICKLERTHTLAIWHDHSTLLGKGDVMITVTNIYDRAVFKTTSELEGSHIESVQALVEQPELHMLAVCSSTVEDKAALIGDRNSCRRELSTPLYDSRGTMITDQLVFFYGDKAAQQVERGSQQGGGFTNVAVSPT